MTVPYDPAKQTTHHTHTTWMYAGCHGRREQSADEEGSTVTVAVTVCCLLTAPTVVSMQRWRTGRGGMEWEMNVLGEWPSSSWEPRLVEGVEWNT